MGRERSMRMLSVVALGRRGKDRVLLIGVVGRERRAGSSARKDERTLILRMGSGMLLDLLRRVSRHHRREQLPRSDVKSFGVVSLVRRRGWGELERGRLDGVGGRMRLSVLVAVRGVLRSRRVLARWARKAGVGHGLGVVSRLRLVRGMGRSLGFLLVVERRNGRVGVVAVVVDGRGEASRFNGGKELLVRQQRLLILGRVDGSVLVLERALVGGAGDCRATGIDGEADDLRRLRLDDLGLLPSRARSSRRRLPLPSRRDYTLLLVADIALPVLSLAVVSLARQILLLRVQILQPSNGVDPLGDGFRHPLSDSLLALLVDVVGDLLHLGDGFKRDGGVGLAYSLDELAHGLVVGVGVLAFGAGPALLAEGDDDNAGGGGDSKGGGRVKWKEGRR
jgi:hypothetical protein